MNLLFKIVKNDLRLIFRDKSLMIMFIVPIAIILICRFGISQLVEIVPGLPDYFWLIVAGLTMVNAATPSYLFGFIMLDERDENIHIMLKILPVPENFLLKSRLVFMILIGYLFSAAIFLYNGLIHLPYYKILLISFLFALIPPVSTFAITAFAKNKIEAATLYKALNVLLFIPVIAFFVEGGLKMLFKIIPFFWIFETIRLSMLNLQFIFPFLFALITNIALAWLLYIIYKKRNS